MELQDAIELIRFNAAENTGQHWADLGCGKGLFTKALASQLPHHSLISAYDRDSKALQAMPKEFGGVRIETHVLDFTGEQIVLPQMDGILMANSLHYVKDKAIFIKRVMNCLKGGGYFLLVEYDLHKANQWVPYPIPMEEARELFRQEGARQFQVLNNRRSVFGQHNMYSALIQK